MTDHTPSGLPQPQTVAAIERARKALHGCYGADTTEINVGVLCELINALSAPAVETVAVQEASKREPCAVCGDWLCDANPLPVAPKAEPVAWINKFGGITKLPETAAAWRKDGGVRPLVYGDTTPQAASAQPVVADTLTEAAQDLLDTELSDLACTGSDAPVEDALGRLRDALASTPRAIPAEQAAPTEPGRNPSPKGMSDE